MRKVGTNSGFVPLHCRATITWCGRPLPSWSVCKTLFRGNRGRDLHQHFFFSNIQTFFFSLNIVPYGRKQFETSPVKVYTRITPTACNRPHVALWLERPLRVQEVRVRYPTASHQRHKKWEVFASQLGAWH